MKAYTAYSNTLGPCEGAVLVFANTAREAKKLAWQTYVNDLCDNEWTDLRVTHEKKRPWLMEQAVKDIPHVIDAPLTCTECLLWGGEIGDDGLCEDCRENMETAE